MSKRFDAWMCRAVWRCVAAAFYWVTGRDNFALARTMAALGFLAMVVFACGMALLLRWFDRLPLAVAISSASMLSFFGLLLLAGQWFHTYQLRCFRRFAGAPDLDTRALANRKRLDSHVVALNICIAPPLVLLAFWALAAAGYWYAIANDRPPGDGLRRRALNRLRSISPSALPQHSAF